MSSIPKSAALTGNTKINKGPSFLSAAAGALGVPNPMALAKGLLASKPEKAYIQMYTVNAKKKVSKSTKILCLFRPNKLTIQKDAKWTTDPTAKSNVARPTFGGSGSASMTLNLFFDTTDSGDDVRGYTDQLIALTVLHKAADTQPPVCRFTWGKITTFLAYVTKVEVTYSYFLGNGTPLRADVTLTMKQYKDEGATGAQNPTSYSEARKTWVVTEGERLDWIAYQEYGNPRHWRHIADVNDLANPFDLRSGQVLKLTPLP